MSLEKRLFKDIRHRKSVEFTSGRNDAAIERLVGVQKGTCESSVVRHDLLLRPAHFLRVVLLLLNFLLNHVFLFLLFSLLLAKLVQQIQLYLLLPVLFHPLGSSLFLFLTFAPLKASILLE